MIIFKKIALSDKISQLYSVDAINDNHELIT